MRVWPALVVALLFVPVPTASAQVDAGVVCITNTVPSPTAEARYFCEPMDSVGFVQFDQFIDGLLALEAAHPDFLEAKIIGESVEGRPIYFVEITNEKSATPRDDKIQIGYSASIHANEAAGREGMVRVLEDLAAGLGPHGASLQPLLDDLIVNVWFPNPDSWASGDYFSGDSIEVAHPCQRGPVPLVGGPSIGYCSGFDRENALGVDLNREFPNPGWIEPDHTPMSEPESQAVVNELRFSGEHSNLAAGADLHGMINSPNMIRSIIPNQDYDLRRMVLIVDQLQQIQDRVEADPAFAEWAGLNAIVSQVPDLEIPNCDDLAVSQSGVSADACISPSDVHGPPMAWGARWDMIGYTDSGFTSDYLTLSPRSPTGGMGAVGTIVEFAYSHVVPDNKYVGKLTDMHVAGVRQIVRTQMEMATRLESPQLVDTGPTAYVWTDSWVSSTDDPNAYVAPHGRDFDLDDPEARYEFNQVPYKVSNLNFWADLGRFTDDPVDPLDAATVSLAALADYEHLAITDQALDGLSDEQLFDIAAWVNDGGNLLLTDGALRFLDRAGITSGAVASQCVYVGHSELETYDHPLMAGVDWPARVTAEASATGFKANSGSDWNYPEWGVARTAFEGLGGQVVGTTVGHAATGESCVNESMDRLVTLGRLPFGGGTIDVIGGALPQPTQAYDHRYGLADYSVSALTYWVVMNSLGGRIEYQSIDEPFVPSYDFDPLYGGQNEAAEVEDKDTPMVPLLAVFALLGAAAIVLRRRR